MNTFTMNLMSSFMLNAMAFGAGASDGGKIATERVRAGFELCVVARDSGDGTALGVVTSTGDALLVTVPPALSSSDFKRARADTESSWFVLSGRHRTSTLRLKLKATSLIRFQETLDRVIRRGEQMAILLNGEVIGVRMFQHRLAGDEIAIDASYFCEGTEKEKEAATRKLARQVNSTLD